MRPSASARGTTAFQPESLGSLWSSFSTTRCRCKLAVPATCVGHLDRRLRTSCRSPPRRWSRRCVPSVDVGRERMRPPSPPATLGGAVSRDRMLAAKGKVSRRAAPLVGGTRGAATSPVRGAGSARVTGCVSEKSAASLPNGVTVVRPAAGPSVTGSPHVSELSVELLRASARAVSQHAIARAPRARGRGDEVRLPRQERRAGEGPLPCKSLGLVADDKSAPLVTSKPLQPSTSDTDPPSPDRERFEDLVVGYPASRMEWNESSRGRSR